jgi:hypothetical protein
MAETHAAVITLPGKPHQLELADRRIVQSAWCDAHGFTNPCHTCTARYPESGNQIRSASLAGARAHPRTPCGASNTALTTST